MLANSNLLGTKKKIRNFSISISAILKIFFSPNRVKKREKAQLTLKENSILGGSLIKNFIKEENSMNFLINYNYTSSITMSVKLERERGKRK